MEEILRAWDALGQGVPQLRLEDAPLLIAALTLAWGVGVGAWQNAVWLAGMASRTAKWGWRRAARHFERSPLEVAITKAVRGCPFAYDAAADKLDYLEAPVSVLFPKFSSIFSSLRDNRPFKVVFKGEDLTERLTRGELRRLKKLVYPVRNRAAAECDRKAREAAALATERRRKSLAEEVEQSLREADL